MEPIEKRWGQERGRHFFRASQEALRISLERLNFQKIGLEPKLPLCSEQDAIYIDEIIPRAREGFALAMKTDRTNLSQDRDLLKHAMPFTVEGIWPDIKLTFRQNTLPEYGHVLTTLTLLAQSRKVSFFDFADTPSNIDYQTGMSQTYWSHTTDSFEAVWTRMGEIEYLTKKVLFTESRLDNQDLLKVGHFYIMSRELSRIFDLE